MKNWHGIPDNKEIEWRKAFTREVEKCDLDIACPLCGCNTLHRYYKRIKPLLNLQVIDGIAFNHYGALWQWCSTCFSYEHYSGLVPHIWEPQFSVPEGNLQHIPESIEQARLLFSRNKD